jgi:predicted transcriptional regulator
MRTTVDLPPAIHRRAMQLAKQRGQSLSSVIAELATYGLSRLDEPLVVTTEPQSGFPVVSLGRHITSEDVADALDDE